MTTQYFADWYFDDRAFIWHPYSAFASSMPLYPVTSAQGVCIELADGRSLIDGMASWWCVIHGYNHPRINAAMKKQIDKVSHVMFGGLTHEPAALLAKKLVSITPDALETVFFSDSGSVSVEVAMKMAIQYWQAKQQPRKQKFISFQKGYHGDTLGAMSVCDPITGMHTMFNSILAKQFFVSPPVPGFDQDCNDEDLTEITQTLTRHIDDVAAVIVEPIVQGAGGMRFYSAEYLTQLRALCDQHGVLLILDEIATGFGRTGKLFASEHANICADIMCIGKSLTGGYLSLAATMTTSDVAQTISQAEPGVFMHGPTFMANPLACATALASIELLETSNWQSNIAAIETHFNRALAPCRDYSTVEDVRVLGGIGVVEMTRPVDMQAIMPRFVDAGIWVRPFGKLVYLMPPYVIQKEQLDVLTAGLSEIVSDPQILLD